MLMEKAKNFIVWLDGFLSACDSDKLNEKQTKIIKDKLNNIFEHEAESTGPNVLEFTMIEEDLSHLGYGKPPHTDSSGEVIFRC
jgi:hypothetical protein